jgi:UDP-sugar diphosphatase
MLKKVTITEVVPNDNPKYVKTKKILAVREDGREIVWEMTDTHDSVHILVDNIDTNQLFFVKQVRIPVLVNDPVNDGHVYECCAGIVDKDIPLIEIAREEILEEIGYDISLDDIQFIRSVKNSVGSAGRTSNLFYAQIQEHQKVSDGGGLHSEDIEVVKIHYDEVRNFIMDETIHTDSSTLFLATVWSLQR